MSELADVIYSRQQCVLEETEAEKMMRRPSVIEDFDPNLENEPRKTITFDHPGASGRHANPSQMNATTKSTAKKPQTVVFGTQTAPIFNFEKSYVAPTSPKAKKVGGLSMLLNPSPESTADSKPHMPSGPTFKVTMYWPNRQGMELDVYEIATVGDAIKLALQAHKDRGLSDPTVYHAHPECYELRMHEDDGEPDHDVPRLDKERKLQMFGDDSYCICEIPSQIPPKALATGSSPVAIASTGKWKVY